MTIRTLPSNMEAANFESKTIASSKQLIVIRQVRPVEIDGVNELIRMKKPLI